MKKPPVKIVKPHDGYVPKEPPYLTALHFLRLHPYTRKETVAQLAPGTRWGERAIRWCHDNNHITFSIGSNGEQLWHPIELPRRVESWNE